MPESGTVLLEDAADRRCAGAVSVGEVDGDPDLRLFEVPVPERTPGPVRESVLPLAGEGEKRRVRPESVRAVVTGTGDLRRRGPTVRGGQRRAVAARRPARGAEDCSEEQFLPYRTGGVRPSGRVCVRSGMRTDSERSAAPVRGVVRPVPKDVAGHSAFRI